MEEDKILEEEKAVDNEVDPNLPDTVESEESGEEHVDASETSLEEQKQEDDGLTEEERLAKAKKAKLQERLQPIKYFLCAVSAGVIQFLSALLLRAVILKNFIAADASIHFIVDLNEITFISDTIGLGLSIIWNFTLNRKFTFKDAGNVPLAMALAFLFYVPFYPFQIWYIDTIEKAIITSTAGKLDTLAFIIAQGTCMVYNFVLEFLWQKFVVFRKKKKE